MSFKREGEDREQLSVLKKRRVTELLSEDIPEDEALRTKNGRLCCLVCHNRPVFDTLEMIYLHRGGKKHKQNAESFYDKQRELQMLKEKRKHDAYIKTGSAMLQQVASREGSGKFSLSLATGQYNPRVKKKLKPDQRRTTIQLDQSEANGKEENRTTPLTLLPGYVKPYVSNRGFCQPGIYSQHQTAGSSTNTASQLGDHGGNEKLRIGPIQKQSLCGFQQNPPKTIAEYRKVSKLKKQEMTVSPYSKSCLIKSNPVQQPETKNLSVGLEHKTAGKSERRGQTRRVNCELQEDKEKPRVGPESSTEEAEERKRKAEHYLQARGSGWKLDWSGQKWIQDEDAEFDSDEEPPEL